MGRTSVFRGIRRHRLFLLCVFGICVLSLFYCYKTLQQDTFQKSGLKSLALLSDFIWGDPLSTVLPEKHRHVPYNRHNHQGVIKIVRESDAKDANLVLPDPTGPYGDLHKRAFILKEDKTLFFINIEPGGLCLQEGTQIAEDSVDKAQSGQRSILEHHEKNSTATDSLTDKKSKKAAKCKCRQGWHGPNCGVPTVVQHSNLPTKSHLRPRKFPRRLINAININHEFDLLHARFHELADTVDLFLVCESNFTAYGEAKPLLFLQLLLNGTFNYIKHKILYVFLDHFPKGGRADGWIADDYLRTFLTKNGLSRVQGLRSDDVFILDDADEIPVREGLLFLKLYDGWTEPVGIHMRKSLYGFYWRQLGTLDVLSACTMAMLLAVYKGDGILLRRRDYYSMPGFRQYEKNSGHVLIPWSIGSPVHYAGWHCSWCFRPEGIYHKLISAQNGDFPRWGDFAEKRKLSYIKELIRTGGWFDGSEPNYPPTDPKEHMFAPKYFLENFERYSYLIENPYSKKGNRKISS